MPEKHRETNPFVTADKLPRIPAPIERDMLALQGQPQTSKTIKEDEITAIREALIFLKGHKLCDPGARSLAHVYLLALDKAIADCEDKARREPAHSGKIHDETNTFIINVIGKEARGLMQFELEREQVRLLPGRCERLAEEAAANEKKVPAWVANEAKKKPVEFMDDVAAIVNGHDPERLAESDIPTRGMHKLLATVFAHVERVGQLKWVVDYDGPRFTDGAAKLGRAREIVGYVADNEGDLKGKVEALAGLLGISEDTIKKAMREVAYAAYDGAERITEGEAKALGTLGEGAFELDLRRTPHSLNEEIRKFHYAIMARQLNPERCKKMTAQFLAFPEERDVQDMRDAYLPLEGNVVYQGVIRIMYHMKMAVKAKEEALDAHPVRAVSWFKQLKGRITEFEKEEIARAAKEKGLSEEQVREIRTVQLDYDLNRAQAIRQFMLQAKELREFIGIYGSGLDPEFRSMLTELLSYDPLTGDDIVEDPDRLERYLSSLDKTLDRWSDLCRDPRDGKVPYNFERALKHRYSTPGGAEAARIMKSAAEQDMEARMRDIEADFELGLERIGAVAEAGRRIDSLREVKEDMLDRLESVSKHTRAAKKIYRSAMGMQENGLGGTLPTKKQKKEKKRKGKDE